MNYHVGHPKAAWEMSVTVLPVSALRPSLFDLDGTLIDSAPDLGRGGRPNARQARGLPSLPLELYRPMAGAGARGMLGIAVGIWNDHPEDAGLRREMKEEFFVNYERCMTQRTRAV